MVMRNKGDADLEQEADNVHMTGMGYDHESRHWSLFNAHLSLKIFNC